MVGYIYEIKFSNGKRYIGKSEQFTNRMKCHIRCSKNPNNKYYNLPLYRAMRKHTYVINKLEVPIHELDHWETYYIDVFQTYPPNKGFGYNCTTGGDGKSGNIVSVKTRKKISESLKKRRELPGGVHKVYHKWRASGECPGKEYIGMYFTRDRAVEACWTFYNTGVKLPNDRRKSTGSIRNTKYNKYRFSFYKEGKYHSKTYKTREEAEAAQQLWCETQDVNLILKK